MRYRTVRSVLLAGILALLPLGSAAQAQDLFVGEATAQVKRFDGATGAFIEVFTSGGPGGTRGLALGTDLNLYVGIGTQIKKHNGFTGDFIELFVDGGGPFSTTQGITLGSDGLFYVCTRSSGVVRFTAGGTFVDTFASGGGLDAQSLVFGPDGRVYVTSLLSDEVRRYDETSGALIDVFVPAGSGGLYHPSGLVFGPDGNLYVTSQAGDVKRYSGTTGAYMGSFAGGGMSNPQGIAFGPDGNLYVVVTGGGEVHRFNGGTGADMGSFATGLSNPVNLLFFTPEQPVAAEPATWGGVKALFR